VSYQYSEELPWAFITNFYREAPKILKKKKYLGNFDRKPPMTCVFCGFFLASNEGWGNWEKINL
jgi:hypothetical protein